MQNKFFGIGRWTKDNEMRYSANGVAILNNTIAMNDKFNKDNTTFLPVVMFQKAAENVASYTSKGSLISVEGRIQVRTYENREGRTVYMTEVVAERVQFLDTKPKEDRKDRNAADDLYGGGEQTEVSDEELPF